MQDLPTLRPGDKAPALRLQTAEGQEIVLADFHGRPVLLVFLRHLG